MIPVSPDQLALPVNNSANRLPTSDGIGPPGPSPTLPEAVVLEPAAATSAGAVEEADVWWGSYAGRTMLPSFLVCGLLTAAIGGAAWYLWEAAGLEGRFARSTAYGLVAAVWLFQMLRWGYRVVGTNYRLTTRRLFRDRGFLHPADGEMELACVAKVMADQTPLERLLGVGRVCIISYDHAAPPLVLPGVASPQQVVAEIEICVQQARTQNVAALRAAAAWGSVGSPEAGR